jgi:hypothetical protein
MSSLTIAVENIEVLYKAITNNMVKNGMPQFNKAITDAMAKGEWLDDETEQAWTNAMLKGGLNGLRYCPDRHSWNGAPLALKFQGVAIAEENRTVLATHCLEVRSKSNPELVHTAITQEITAKGSGEYRHSKSLNVGKPKGHVVNPNIALEVYTAETLQADLRTINLGRAWVIEDAGAKRYGHPTSPKSVDQWNIGVAEMRNLWTGEMVRRNKDRLEGLSYEGIPAL